MQTDILLWESLLPDTCITGNRNTASKVLRDRTGGKKDIPMMMSDVPELHVCPECMAEDEEPYLHTVHQLPGVQLPPLLFSPHLPPFGFKELNMVQR